MYKFDSKDVQLGVVRNSSDMLIRVGDPLFLELLGFRTWEKAYCSSPALSQTAQTIAPWAVDHLAIWVEIGKKESGKIGRINRWTWMKWLEELCTYVI